MEINNFYSGLDGSAGWLFSEEANNIGSFISGCCGMVLVILGICTFIYGPRLIRGWQKEKRAERLSDIAEVALNHLESSVFKATTWLTEAYSVYSRHSSENKAHYQSANDNVKMKLEKMYKEDSQEVNNFCRGFNAIINELIIAKNRAERLGDLEVKRHFEELVLIFQKLPLRLARLHREDFPIKEKEIAHAFLEEEAPKQIEEHFKAIKSMLYKYLRFE